MNAPQTQTEIAALAPRIITVNLPSKEKMDRRAANLLASAESLTIDSDSMALIATEELADIKATYKKLEQARTQHVSPLNAEVKYINNWFRDALGTIENAEGALKRKLLTYQNEQAQKRREEEARLERERQKERERLAAEQAERERQAQAEAARKLAEHAQALERERRARDEAARRQKELDDAIKAGEADKAREAARLQSEAEAAAATQRDIAEQAQAQAAATVAAANEETEAARVAMIVATPPAMAPALKLAGISTKGTYKGKCTSLLDLVRFIAAHPEHVNLVKPNDSAINLLAKAQREACKVDGILVWQEQTLAARSA